MYVHKYTPAVASRSLVLYVKSIVLLKDSLYHTLIINPLKVI